MAELLHIDDGVVSEVAMPPTPALSVHYGEAYVNFPFSNDRDLHLRHRELFDAAKRHPYDYHDAAVVVGSGAVTSFAPVLPHNIWFTDYSTELLSWMDHQLAVFQSFGDVEEFHTWIMDTYPTVHTKVTREWLNLGDRHVLASNENFHAAQEALDQATLHFVQIDYREADSVHALGAVLDEADQQVRFMNMTNMHAHAIKRNFPYDIRAQADELAESIAELPTSDADLLIFASGRGSILTPLPTATSGEQYGDIIQDDITSRAAELKAKFARRQLLRGTNSDTVIRLQ